MRKPMDGYLKRRLSNPAYGGSSAARLDEYSVYERCVQQQLRTDAHPLQRVRHEASASKLHHATDKAEKETKKEDGDKKKKKKKKKEKRRATSRRRPTRIRIRTRAGKATKKRREWPTTQRGRV